jgi:hypothetical protein
MARWTSMTVAEWKQRFHEGQARGRISWLAVAVQYSQVFLGFEAVRVILAAQERTLDRTLSTSSICVCIGDLTLALAMIVVLLRRSNTEIEKVYRPIVWGCGASALVLILCIPKLF